MIRLLFVALVIMAPAVAGADQLGRQRGAGWAFHDDWIDLAPGRDGRIGLGFGLHYGRYTHGLQLRAEASGAVATPQDDEGSRHLFRVGGAVRYAALEHVIHAYRTLGLALAVDVGAGHLWYADDRGGTANPYLAVGVLGAMVLQHRTSHGPDSSLSFAFGPRFTFTQDGWTMAAGVEIEWGR